MGVRTAMRYIFHTLMNRHTDVSKAFGVKFIQSYEMDEALREWDELYRKTDGIHLFPVITSEIARLALLEFDVNISGNSARKDIVSKVMNKELSGDLRRQLEYGCAYGSMIIKPCIEGGSISIDHVKPNAFIPLEFDSSNRLTSVICLERKSINGAIYTKAEKCTYKDNTYTVQTKAYYSTDYYDLGVEVKLSEVEAWGSLKPFVTIKNVDRPLFGFFRYPAANNIDIDSPLGVSVCSKSCNTLRDLDASYNKFNTEIDTSDKVLFAADYLLSGINNKKIERKNPLPNLIKGLNFTTNGTEIKEWVPEIRDQAYKSVMQMYIDTVTIQCGFDSGYFTFDSSDGVIRTATEVRADQQRTLSTITDVQIELKKAIEDLLYGIIALIDLYELAPEAEDFNYSIKYKDFNLDPEQERERMLKLIEKGIYPKWKYLVEFEGYTEEKAREFIKDMEESKNG